MTSTPTLRLVEAGQLGRALSGWTQINLGTDDGTASTIVISYQATHPTAGLLADQVEVALLVDGVELDDGRFVLDESATDEVVDDELAVWKGFSDLGELRHARVYPYSWPSLETPNFPIGGQTPGWALRELVERAQTRGALTGLTWDFTDTADSAGQPWPTQVTETLETGNTYLEVVESWHERELASARMRQGVLQLYSHGNQGRDLTSTIQLLRGRDLLNGPVDRSSRDAVSTMLAISNNIAVEVDDATALSRYGRREGFVSQATAPDEPTLTTIADATLAVNGRQREGLNYDLALAYHRPFLDFDRGDTVEVRVRDVDRTVRVRQLAVQWSFDGGATGQVSFGDRFTRAADAAQERLQQLTSASMDGGMFGSPQLPGGWTGGTGGGGDGGTGGGSRDTLAPAAPANLRATNTAYLVNGRAYSVAISMAWDPVTTNVDGTTANDINYYVVHLLHDYAHETEWLYDYWEPIGTTPPEQTSVALTDLAPDQQYRVRVRAVDWWGNHSGWAETAVATGHDTTPPEYPPSAPGVEPALFGALRVSWDGLDSAGFAVADDADHVDVHLSTTSMFTPTDGTRVGTIPVPAPGQSMDTIVTDLQPGTTYYLRLVLLDVWGNTSEPGPQGSGVPQSLTAEPGPVGPENLTFADYGNLVPDGSFERPEYRAITGGRFEESEFGGNGTWIPSALAGFVENTGQHVLFDADVTDPAAWHTREGTAPIAGADGLVKDGAAGHVRWSTVATIPFDAATLYLVRYKLRIDRAPTVDTGFYGVAETKTPDGVWHNVNGANSMFLMPEVAASNRSLPTTDSWYSYTGYMLGTAPTPSPNREGPYNDPVPAPQGTGQLGMQVTLDFPDGDGSYTLGAATIEQPAVSVHGDWSLEFTGGGLPYQRAVLADLDSPGADTQYYVRMWARVIGPKTSQPTVLAGADFVDTQGATIPTDGYVLKSGGFAHDGWYLIEGRFQRDPDAQWVDMASAHFFVGAYNLAADQRLQIDAVEFRQVATNVLIADAAITDAKIKNLSASKITAGTINAVVTVSGRIATAETGARVELDATGLKGYSSTGSRTLSINTETGTAQLDGFLGDVDVQGYVRAVNSGAQINMDPRGMTVGGSAYPAILISPGAAPLEKSPGIFGGVHDTVSNALYTTFSTPFMQLEGGNQLTGTYFQLYADCYDDADAGEEPEMISSRAWFTFAKARTFTDGGGRAIIENHWTYNFHPPELGGDFNPGHRVSFTGKTIYGHRAGMDIVPDRTDDPAAVWVDFRRDAYVGGAWHTNGLYVGIRADAFVIGASMESTKTDIVDTPFTATELVRSNPAKQWRYHDDEVGTRRFGPMADNMPEGVAVTDSQSGMRGLSLNAQVGVLWKAIEELTDRIEGLEQP